MRIEHIIYEDVDVKCFAERWKQSGIFISMFSDAELYVRGRLNIKLKSISSLIGTKILRK